MTGFGRARATRGDHAVDITLRSLNARSLEVRVRGLADLPLLAQRCEDRLRAAFSRGSLDLSVRLEGALAPKGLSLDAARKYLQDLHRLREELGLPDPPTLGHLLSLGVFAEERPEEEELWPVVEEALEGAIAEVAAARAREGEALREALARETDALRAGLEEASRLAPLALAGARARIEARLDELRAQADPARLETELVLWAERSDVQEELDRLETHLARLQALLDTDGPVGRELEFLSQEMAREAGTLSAKARSADLAQAAVAIRLAVDRIREQARNVE